MPNLFEHYQDFHSLKRDKRHKGISMKQWNKELLARLWNLRHYSDYIVDIEYSCGSFSVSVLGEYTICAIDDNSALAEALDCLEADFL